MPPLQSTYGHSVEGRALRLFSLEAEATGGTLLVGGLHGDEWGTISLLESFLPWVVERRFAAPVRVLPLANPDGLERNSRYNARGVDLNRNFDAQWSPSSEEPPGDAPWSEPESRALRDLILTTRPERIVSLHWALAELDADGPQSTPLAHAMWAALSPKEQSPYRLRLQPDAPEVTAQGCPGSMGRWCGYQVEYPDGTSPAMVTLELPYAPTLPRPADPLPEDHLDTLRAAWQADAAGYLAAAEGAVHTMLRAACPPLLKV